MRSVCTRHEPGGTALLLALTAASVLGIAATPCLAQSADEQPAWFGSIGGRSEKWLMPTHTVGIVLTEASGFKATSYKADLNVRSTQAEIGFRVANTAIGSPLRISVFGETASGKADGSHETSLAPGLAGIFVLPRLDGTIGGGSWTFGAGEEITDVVRLDAAKWQLGLRAAAEFRNGAHQTWTVGGSVSGGRSSYDSGAVSNYVDLFQPDFVNTLSTSIGTRSLEAKLEASVRQRLVGPLSLFASAAAGLSIKDAQLNAAQFIYNTVQASTSYLSASDVRAGVVAAAEIGLTWNMGSGLELRVSGTGGYDGAVPYFRAQTGAAPGPYPAIIPASPAQMAFGDMVSYGASAALMMKF